MHQLVQHYRPLATFIKLGLEADDDQAKIAVEEECGLCSALSRSSARSRCGTPTHTVSPPPRSTMLKVAQSFVAIASTDISFAPPPPACLRTQNTRPDTRIISSKLAE